MIGKLFTVITLSAVLVCSLPVLATNDRIDRSFSVFEKGVDDLLLETAHVYVRLDDKVQSFYLKGMGAFFMGHISITSMANVSVMIQDWDNWFQDSDTEIVVKDEDDGEKKTEDKIKLKELEKKKKIYISQKKKYDQLKDKDQQRLKEMDMHVSEFKKELITTVLDFGPILKGLSSSDEIVVIFFVKDKEFQAKYGSSELILRIPFGYLKKLNDMDPDNSKVKAAFKFNI
jgi:hypothetical protein